MPIVGTAGHVDHGKSALVEALTGTNPDRWLEERLRGMTLDLGFARLVLDDGLEAGIVDVPGHERFLHNMLAGAAGMELLLLVVAADEGVMPQTREHLDVLRFLNVAQTIVVVTKIDLVREEARSRRSSASRTRCAATIAGGAPRRRGLEPHGRRLDRSCARELPKRCARCRRATMRAPVYLPIDRVFTLPGHGTIVTGTLDAGDASRPATRSRCEPSGTRARVRSLARFR